MRRFIAFCIYSFLCFLPTQIVFSNPSQKCEIFLDYLTDAAETSFDKKSCSDWKKKLMSFGRSIQILEKECHSKSDDKNDEFYNTVLEKIKEAGNIDGNFIDALEKKLNSSTNNLKQNDTLRIELKEVLEWIPVIIVFLIVLSLLPVSPLVQNSSMKNTFKENLSSGTFEVEEPEPQSPADSQKKELSMNAIMGKFWWVVGTSVVGKSHLDNVPPLPCQDSHCLEESADKIWGVAVVCDGAGSATHSHLGAQFVAKKSAKFFKMVAEKTDWYKRAPTPKQWHDSAKAILKEVRRALESFFSKQNIEIRALSCTVIVVVFLPTGLLVTHIGDGRGGYRNDKGEWKSLLKPLKGEEANQTVFITSDIWSESDKYIESRVITEPSTAFVIMTDGCESHCFQTYNRDEKSEQFQLVDVNRPHAGFFEPLFKTIQAMKDNESEELKQKWTSFIQSGTEGLKNEPDDKTMLIGILKKSK